MSVENNKQTAMETIEENTKIDDKVSEVDPSDDVVDNTKIDNKVSEEDPSDEMVDNKDTPCNQQCTLQTQEDLLAVCR